MIRGRSAAHRVPIAYCNAVGGNDQLIFDGNSFAVGADGVLLAKLAPFAEQLAVVDLQAPPAAAAITFQSEPEEVHDALVLGLRDYLHKCGFKSAVLGLSGGIDLPHWSPALRRTPSAPKTSWASPCRTEYSSRGSIEDSRLLAERLGIKFLQIPIKNAFETVRAQFKEIFAGLPENEAEENMQPRLRGLTLMALSNKLGHLLLSTGNKSELSVGSCTLYGDLCGGLAVISDVPKLLVYLLSRWINRDREIIPRATLEKPPSAELKPDQAGSGYASRRTRFSTRFSSCMWKSSFPRPRSSRAASRSPSSAGLCAGLISMSTSARRPSPV